jgi:hypothetical protein
MLLSIIPGRPGLALKGIVLKLWMMTKSVRYEQAVYGSFPFWNRGYAVLARSAGCRPEWVDGLRLAAQRLGEAPTGIAVRECLFAMQLSRGPWMIVGVFPQGCDDRGRPGALAFHAVFVGRWSYRWLGAGPFVFAPMLRGDWSASDEGTTLPSGRFKPAGHSVEQIQTGIEDSRIDRILSALTRGQRVVIPSAEPMTGLAHAVWTRLPGRIRCCTSVATWAFSNANRFDLVAVPRLACIEAGDSDLVLEADQ